MQAKLRHKGRHWWQFPRMPKSGGAWHIADANYLVYWHVCLSLIVIPVHLHPGFQSCHFQQLAFKVALQIYEHSANGAKNKA